MPITYKCFGARCEWSQIDRIESGLKKIGLEESALPDFIYANDSSSFEEAISYKTNNSPRSYLILCLLDIPEHILEHYDLEKVKNQLIKADKIVCISKFVQQQIKKFLGLDAEIIYNPIKDIYPDFSYSEYSKFDFLFAGRNNDFNKRTNLGAHALALLGYSGREVLCIGPENPGFGNYIGVVPSKELNKIYNSVKFVFCLGKIEGIGLQALETLSAEGAIPIVLNDCTTYLEFFEKSKDILNINPTVEDIAKFIYKASDADNFSYIGNKLRENHGDFIRDNFSSVAIATKIKNIFILNNRLLEFPSLGKDI